MYPSKYSGVSNPERTQCTESEFAYTRLFRVVGSVMACTLLNLLEKMPEVATRCAVFNILESNIDTAAGLLHTMRRYPCYEFCFLFRYIALYKMISF
jgi:hypothetical protein